MNALLNIINQPKGDPTPVLSQSKQTDKPHPPQVLALTQSSHIANTFYIWVTLEAKAQSALWTMRLRDYGVADGERANVEVIQVNR